MSEFIPNEGKGINLYYDSWCPVVRISTGECKDVSFSDALLNAKDYILSTSTRFEQVSILRNLCALAGSILYKYDSEGTEAFVKDPDDAIERWKKAYTDGFSETAVKNYGEKWKDHFFLHDEKLPFYQNPGLCKIKPPKDKKALYCVSKLNPLVFESGNKASQFSVIKGENKSVLTEAELARGLMFIQAFNDNAAKDNKKLAGMSWPGHRTTVYAEGQNLLETILLNIPMFDGIMELWDGMTPEWEKTERPTEPTFSSVIPRDPAMMFTAQSRRIELLKDEEHKYGPHMYEYGISRGGDIYDGIKDDSGKKKPIEFPMNDPMIVCNLSENVNEPPTANGKMDDKNIRNMWLISVSSFLKAQNKAAEEQEDTATESQEKASGVAVKQKKITSGLFSWLSYVGDLEDIEVSALEARLQFTSLRYKTMQSSFDDLATASSVVRLGINKDEEWRDFLTEETANINAIAMVLNRFEKRMALAAGGDDKAEWAQSAFMDCCREPFERLVYYSKPGADKEKLKKAWSKKVTSITDNILIDLLDRLNIDGATIREVQAEKGKAKILYTPGEAYCVKENIRNILSA